MANSMKNKRAITKALMMDGMALMREITAILRPSFLDIIRKGRSTLNILTTLMNWMFMSLKMMEITENTTITKSMMFQEMRRYEFLPLKKRPKCTILRADSKQKMIVITRSIWFSTTEVVPLGSFKGLSIAMSTVEKIITKMIKGSKNGWRTMFLTMILKRFVGCRKNNESP